MVEQKDGAVTQAAGRRYWREMDARVVLEGWRESGESLSAFARRHDVSARRLGRWRRRLGAEQTAAPVRFHPVRVRQDVAGLGGSEERIELVLAGGRSVRLPHGFAAEDLSRVLAVVEGRG